jgi:hypothetical protein
MFGIIIVSALLATLGRAQNCVLQVPANPLTAKGLQTPYVQSNCSQRAGTASFVECAIYDGQGGLSYYAPLIIDQGDVVGKNFIAPVNPNLPANAMVACYFGTNGGSTTLAGPGAAQCTNGLPGGSIFGQFATCGGAPFMARVLADAQRGIIKVPALGTASIGGPCPTVRDFRIVDQDQSDNVITAYALLNNNAIVAQATPANTKGGNATIIVNGSDNRLVDSFIDPALGCTPWMVPSLTAPTGMTGGIATNELLAAFHQAAPVAEVPPTDPMVLDNGNQNLQKTNLYRTAVGQTALQSLNQSPGLAYCNNITAGGIFAAANQALLVNNPSPMPDVANNLFTFLAQRFAASINADNLGCLGLWNLATNPVTLTMDGNGVVTDATINVVVLQQLALGQTVTNTTSSTTTSSTTSMATSTKASATSSSFTVFLNTTKSAATGTVAASSANAVQSLTSNGNKGATFTPSTLATMTVAATNTKTNVAVSSGTAVGGGTVATGTAVGGGTGATSSALVVAASSTCTCPVLTAPTATAAAAAPMFTLLADGLVKNTQTGQLYIPLPAFLDNLIGGGGSPGGNQGGHRRSRVA